MLKTNNPPTWWIGYYFGLNCILHPDTGRWTLTGYFDGQVVCQKYNDNGECIDCMYYPISEVQFILKKINPFLFASMHKFEFFIRTKAMEGYWINFDEKFSSQIVFEP